MEGRIVRFVDACEEFYRARVGSTGHPYYPVLAQELQAMLRYAASKTQPEGP